jgi:hypothetical protein
MITRPDICGAALALVGVRYSHHGRTVDQGLDCAGVLVAAFALNGVALREATLDYSRLPPEEHIQLCLDLNFEKLARTIPAAGDVAHVRFKRDTQARHLGIIVPDYEISIVHALRRERQVVIHPLRGLLNQAEIVGLYQWPNLQS